jgi:hypothetical protein
MGKQNQALKMAWPREDSGKLPFEDAGPPCNTEALYLVVLQWEYGFIHLLVGLKKYGPNNGITAMLSCVLVLT